MSIEAFAEAMYKRLVKTVRCVSGGHIVMMSVADWRAASEEIGDCPDCLEPLEKFEFTDTYKHCLKCPGACDPTWTRCGKSKGHAGACSLPPGHRGDLTLFLKNSPDMPCPRVNVGAPKECARHAKRAIARSLETSSPVVSSRAIRT